ncbi:MAG: M81 family metallopeptidase, partial [Planctomycetaceae bacterium]|nr:M81 family metallopeptidase [Planctomycetaceae bacterium]
TMTEETLFALTDRMLARLQEAGPLDGLLLAAHGATVSSGPKDVDGFWLSKVRDFVGPEMPIVATLDPHANLSPQIVAATDALVAYQTNPHIDQRQRGIEAAKIIAGAVRGEYRPTQAAAFPPMAINIEKQLTEEEPCLGIFQKAKELMSRPDVLSSSVILGFPYADVEEMGSSVVVVTKDNPGMAKVLSNDLGQALWNRREEFVGEFIAPHAAVKEALTREPPVCLLDMGDNAGGGSPADGTILAHHLIEQEIADSFVCLYDPVAVQTAEQAGAGQTIRLTMGGKTDALHGPPISCEVEVLSLHDGKFTESQPRHGGGTHFHQGRTAIVKTQSGLTVMLTSRRQPPFSLSQLTTFGLKPETFRVIVAKGVHAPVAAYREVCKSFIRVNTPGVTAADMRQLPFKNRRKPLFPIEPETTWSP